MVEDDVGMPSSKGIDRTRRSELTNRPGDDRWRQRNKLAIDGPIGLVKKGNLVAAPNQRRDQLGEIILDPPYQPPREVCNGNSHSPFSYPW